MQAWYRAAVSVLAAIPFYAAGASYTCVSFEYPPLIQEGGNGQVDGLAVEIVTSVFKQMGHELKVKLYPWGRS